MIKQVEGNQKAERKQARRMTFTELALKRLKPKSYQYVVWDKPNDRQIGQLGLSVLVSPGGKRHPGGTKRFRATYYVSGKAVSKKLGRVGEMPLGTARKLTAELRGKADAGIDPKEEERRAREQAAAEAANAKSYEAVVDEFIKLYAMPRQRTWEQTRHVLKSNCAAWLAKPIAEITKADARTLLEGFVAEGHGPKAGLTLAWLRTLWRWAYKRDIVAGPIMDAVTIEFEKNVRDRVFTDDEIKTIWQAGDKLDPIEGGYIKLLVLLAPRKTALAGMRRSELDDADNPTVWTTPHERTKSKKTAKKREYLTPLPPLAQRILKGMPKRDDDLVFPGAHKGQPIWPGSPLKKKLISLGAPADFAYHTMRHTIATWLQSAGHSGYEIGLVLNHSSGGVTARYSHGYPLKPKLFLLAKWSSHVAQLVQPAEGVQVLR
jgi:integrase